MANKLGQIWMTGEAAHDRFTPPPQCAQGAQPARFKDAAPSKPLSFLHLGSLGGLGMSLPEIAIGSG